MEEPNCPRKLCGENPELAGGQRTDSQLSSYLRVPGLQLRSGKYNHDKYLQCLSHAINLLIWINSTTILFKRFHFMRGVVFADT